jgi:formylglycine-generating enzyme required for sulfatase activity
MPVIRVVSGLFFLLCFASCGADPDSGVVFNTSGIYRAMATVIPQGSTETVTGSGSEGVFIAGRTVTIPAYAIARYETSWELWREVSAWAASHGYKIANTGQAALAGSGVSSVTSITWRDAVVWCNAYSEMSGLNPVYYTGDSVLRDSRGIIPPPDTTSPADTASMELGNKGYRLPLEAEWEFAARDTDDHGLFDMNGEIAEWCWDWLTREGGENKISAETPLTGDGPGTFAHRVIRGSGWNQDAENNYVTHRNYFRPFSSAPKIGFRVAQSP